MAETYNICAVPEGRAPGASVMTLLFRDALLILILVSVPLLLAEWLSQFGLFWLMAVGAIAAFPAGLRANGLFHEWGHFVGVKLLGGEAPTNRFTQLFPMFHFDMDRNNHQQFMAMSIGGTLTEWLFPVLLLLSLGTDNLIEVGLITGAFTAAISGTLIEGPIIIKSLKSGDSAEVWSHYLTYRDKSIPRALKMTVPLVVLLFASLYLL